MFETSEAEHEYNNLLKTAPSPHHAARLMRAVWSALSKGADVDRLCKTTKLAVLAAAADDDRIKGQGDQSDFNEWEIFKALREAYGCTVREVAERTGVSGSYVSEVENGNASPSYRYVVKFAYAFDLYRDWLLVRSGHLPNAAKLCRPSVEQVREMMRAVGYEPAPSEVDPTADGDSMRGYSDDSIAKRLRWLSDQGVVDKETRRWLWTAAERLMARDCPGIGHALAAIDTLESALTILDHDEGGESAADVNIRSALYHLRQIVEDY